MNLRVLIFAGPNGSGKSTLTTEEILANFKIKAERYINADDIARQDQTSGGPRDQQESEREAPTATAAAWSPRARRSRSAAQKPPPHPSSGNSCKRSPGGEERAYFGETRLITTRPGKSRPTRS